MPFDDLLTPVAVSPVQRHDEPTCCGERQEPDVGEGWRLLGIGDVLQEGDQWGYGSNPSEWYGLPMHRRGSSDLFPYATYRRRVTPEAPAPQPRPAETRETTRVAKGWFADPAAEIAWLKTRIVWLNEEVERLRLTPAVQVEAMSITDTWAAEVARLSAENHLLTAEVERIAMLKSEVTLLGNACEAYTTEIARLRSEVERLRLLPEERAAIKRMIGEPDSHPSWAESRCAKLLRDMLKRQGGGE